MFPLLLEVQEVKLFCLRARRIEENFDVVFSVFDSINFLETFAQWKSTFKSVSEHLSQNGLFIFDMYTPARAKAPFLPVETALLASKQFYR